MTLTSDPLTSDPLPRGQASASQRQGRAGRVQPGEIYRLYGGRRLQQMEPYDTPELLRAPLETVVLDAKVGRWLRWLAVGL